jgi:type II secretory pathway component GspD/PulD (secretin)
MMRTLCACCAIFTLTVMSVLPVRADDGDVADMATAAGDTSTDGEDIIPLFHDDVGGLDASAGVELINVTVEDETLENVVSMFARISGANIVTTPSDLEGTVTVNLRGVEWKPALASILDVHDLVLVEKLPGSGVYSILPRRADASEPLIVDTIFLKFTTVPEISPIANSMLATVSNASISAFASRNAMVIRTTEGNMRQIKTLIETMDVPGKQVVVEAKFMELTDSASEQLGIRWDSLEEWGMRLSPGPFTYNRDLERIATRQNSIDFSDARTRTQSSSSDSSAADTTTALFDQFGNQFQNQQVEFVEIPPNSGNYQQVAEVVPTRILETVINSSRNNGDVRTISDTTARSAMDNFTKTIAESQTAILDVGTFNMVISALKKTAGVSVISNPKMIVTSGSTDAYFTVGDREPIIKTEVQRGTQESPGDVITAELDTTINTEYITSGYLETGIHLQVVPVVKTEDLIEAKIQPKLIRRILPDKVVGNNSWPRISVKEILTTFTLRSGQTVAIGGLTDTSDDKQVSKVPLLGDIPLIGKYLFSHEKVVKRQTETIIFVTLSLAAAEGLFREAGIPEDAKIVHRKLIENKHRRAEFEAELEEFRESSDAAASERVRSRLLKRRR